MLTDEQRGRADGSDNSGVLSHPVRRTCPIDPPNEYDELRDSGHVVSATIWNGQKVWLVSRYDDVRAVLASPAWSASVKHPGYPMLGVGRVIAAERQSFARMDDPEHAEKRRAVNGFFTVRRIEAMRARIQAIVDELVDDLLTAGPPADFVQAFALPLSSRVICELLGVPYADHELFQRCAMAAMENDADPAATAAAQAEMFHYVDSLVSAKESHPDADDLLCAVIRREFAEGRLDHEELVRLARLLLAGGFETTANQLALGILTLSRDREAYQFAAEHPDGMAPVVEEVLRYHTVLHNGVPRVALEDVRVGDTLVRAGEAVVLLLPTANRDESAFPESGRLRFDREHYRHLSFGFGVHQCLGQHLARAELAAAFHTIARRMPNLTVTQDLEALTFRHRSFMFGLETLPISW